MYFKTVSFQKPVAVVRLSVEFKTKRRRLAENNLISREQLKKLFPTLIPGSLSLCSSLVVEREKGEKEREREPGIEVG